MADNYLRHKSLPIDEAARGKVRDLVNEYASHSEGHPFGAYGNEIELKKYEYAPIYVVNLHSQYDKRKISDGMYPYKGGTIYTRKYYKPADVDVWAYNLLTTEKYVHDGKSFEVPGSHHVESCGKCGGSGKMVCPSCGGSGTQTCSSCHGNGQIQKSRQEYRHTADKVYSDGHKEPVYNYVTVNYYETCRNCGGSGRVNCYRCSGNGKITCNVCSGYGRNVHCYNIDQELDDLLTDQYFYDPDVAEVAELVDDKKNYDRIRTFHKHSVAISKGVFTEDGELGAKLDSMIGQHAGKTGVNSLILFQDAYIQKVDVTYVEYEYKGSTYTGCIAVKNGKERFYAGVSPITELADKWIKEARTKTGGIGTVKAKKLLEQVEKLNVYGRTVEKFGVQSVVDFQLNKLFNLGNDLMFWLIALVATPFLFNFYSDLNPVLRYAHFVNDPNWAPYGWVPVVQCILFLLLLWFVKIWINSSDHSKERHATVFGYVLSGMGIYILASVLILAVLLGLNYLGLSIFTSGFFWLVWQVIKIALIILVYAIMLAVMLFKWIGGLLGKLWAAIF